VEPSAGLQWVLLAVCAVIGVATHLREECIDEGADGTLHHRRRWTRSPWRMLPLVAAAAAAGASTFVGDAEVALVLRIVAGGLLVVRALPDDVATRV
jgi:hypothetical protein